MISASLSPILATDWQAWAADVCGQTQIRNRLLRGATSTNPMDREAAFRMAIAVLAQYRAPMVTEEKNALDDAETTVLELLTSEGDQHLLAEFAILAADFACDNELIRGALYCSVNRIAKVAMGRLLSALWWHSSTKKVGPPEHQPNGFRIASLLAKTMGHACAPTDLKDWPLQPDQTWVANQMRLAWEKNDWVRGTLWEPSGNLLVFRSPDHTYVAADEGIIAGFYHKSWHGRLKPFCVQHYFCRSNLVLYKPLCPKGFFQANKPPEFAFLEHIQNPPEGLGEACLVRSGQR